MDIDDDPEWLEACMAAVDGIEAANLSRSLSAAPSYRTAHHRNATIASASSGSDHSQRRRVHQDTPTASIPSAVPQVKAGTTSENATFARKQSYTKSSFDAPRGPSKGTTTLSLSNSWRGRRPGGIQGVGAPPEEGSNPVDRELEEVDPCWRCGNPVVPLDFGNSRYYGCSGRPLCKTKRPGPKNGPLIEMEAVAEEDPPDADTRANRGVASVSSIYGQQTPRERGGASRCHLVVRVRGAQQGNEEGSETRAVWALLRKNSIHPMRYAQSSDRSSDHRGRTGETRAVVQLAKRELVRKLAIKEGIAYRDIPHVTFSRLVKYGADGSGRTDNGDSGKTGQKPVARSLEPVDVCEGLMYTLPPELKETLLPFQREGVMYGLRRHGRCLIADEMGTGKTIQALAVMGCYREDWPLLIVAPASMRLMWAEEVERWYPFLTPQDLHVIKGNKDKLYLKNVDRLLWPRVVIVSYFMLRMLADSMGKGDWRAVIFDESHMISTKLGDQQSQAQQVTVCLNIAGRAKRVVLLSGTPSMSKPFDLFNQVEAVSPGLLGKPPAHNAKYEFASNYCGGAMRMQTSRGGETTRIPFIAGCQYADELNLLLKNEVMIRRLKANVVHQLPPLRRIVVRVAEHSEEVKKVLNGGDYGSCDNAEGETGQTNESTGYASGMSEDHRAGLKKVRSASEWVVDKLFASAETKTKFVVFAHHKAVLDRLQEAFDLAGMQQQGQHGNEDDTEGVKTTMAFTCLRIDGEVPTALRASRLIEFNTSEGCRVLVVSITAGGQGLDFTAASNVVFVELPENPSWLRQAEDRLHRRRQEKSVNVYLTVLPPGSHDDNRWLRLSEKLTVQSSVVNGTAAAETINVEAMFNAGGLQDGHFGLGDSERADRSCDGAADAEAGVKGALETSEEEALLTPLDFLTHSASQSPTLRLLRSMAATAASPASKGPRTRPTPTNIEISTRSKFFVNKSMECKTHNGSNVDSVCGTRGDKNGGRISKICASDSFDSKESFSPGRADAGTYRQENYMDSTVSKIGTSPPSRKRQRPRQNASEACEDNVAPTASAFRAWASSSPGSYSAWREWEHAIPPDKHTPPPPRRRDIADVNKRTLKNKENVSDQEQNSESASLLTQDGDNAAIWRAGGMAKGRGTSCSSPIVIYTSSDGEEDAASTDGRKELSASSGDGLRDTRPLASKAKQVERSTDVAGTPSKKYDSSLPGTAIDGVWVSGKRYDASSLGQEDIFRISEKSNNLPTLGQEDDHSSSGKEAGVLNSEDRENLSIVRKSDHGIPHVDCEPRAPSCPGEDEASKEISKRSTISEHATQSKDIAEAGKLVFAVSGHTDRVHVYKTVGQDEVNSPSGDELDEARQPHHCRCNFRPEDLDRVLEAARRWSTDGDASKSQLQEEAREALRMLPKTLRYAPALKVASDFVQDWRALSSRKRALLKNLPCRPPLQEVVSRVTPKLMGSTRRYSSGDGKGHTAGKENRNQRCRSDKVQCLSCGKAASEQEHAVHRRDLYCSARCMEAHASRKSGGSLRRLVLERDGGVCSKDECGRDCLALVSRLKVIRSSQKRREILIQTDPRFDQIIYRNMRERLVQEPREGNAWHADHVTAVYKGGGECGIENLRTLCVLCHAEVTREQTKERALARMISRGAARRTEDTSQQQLVSICGGITLSQSKVKSHCAPRARCSSVRAETNEDVSDKDDILATSRSRESWHGTGLTAHSRSVPNGTDAAEGSMTYRRHSAPPTFVLETEAQEHHDVEFETLISGKDLPCEALSLLDPQPPITMDKAARYACNGNDSIASKTADGGKSTRTQNQSYRDDAEDGGICFTRVRRVVRRVRRSDSRSSSSKTLKFTSNAKAFSSNSGSGQSDDSGYP